MTTAEVRAAEQAIGRLVLALPGIAINMGHQRVQDSLGYLHLDKHENPGMGVLGDIIAGVDAATICERWFGGVDEHQKALEAALNAATAARRVA